MSNGNDENDYIPQQPQNYVIHKHILHIQDRTPVTMAPDAIVLAAQPPTDYKPGDLDVIYLWEIHQAASKPELRYMRIIATGAEFSQHNLVYVATVQMHRVWHVFAEAY